MNGAARMRFGGLAAALAALAVAFGACGGQPEGGGQPEPGSEPQQPHAADPANARFNLTIGDLVPRSGDLAPFAPAAIKSAKLAVERANKALKKDDVKGVEVAVRHADTKTDGRAARSAARKLLGRGATCLTGAWASASTIPVAQAVASAQQVPLISPASTSSQITTLEDQGYVFRTAPSNNLQGEALADVVEEELGGIDEKIVVAGRNDAYGQGLAQTFRRAWEAKGGRLTSSPVLYDPKQPDFKEEAERIVSGDPAAFVIVDFPDTYATVSKELLDTGKFRASRLFVTDGLAGEGLTDTVPERALRGARGTRPGTREEGEDAKTFDRLFTRSDERPRERQTFDAQNFDATMLCFLGAVAAGSGEGAAIKSKLRDVSGPPGRPVSIRDLDEAVRILRRGEDIDYRGASGAIDFDAQGDPTVGTYEVFRYGRRGRFTVERQVEAKAGQGVLDDAGDLSEPQGDEAAR
jgi:ABC-type branched-subunit amino acid transport system substrate-binding protein